MLPGMKLQVETLLAAGSRSKNQIRISKVTMVVLERLASEREVKALNIEG